MTADAKPNCNGAGADNFDPQGLVSIGAPAHGPRGNGKVPEENTDAEPARGQPPDQEVELARLATLPPIEYDREREATAKRLGIRLATLDAEVEARRPPLAAPKPEVRADGILLDPEPWAQQVDGAELLTAISATFKQYVKLPEGAAEAIALWVLFAHGHDAAEHSPLLAFQSPEKRCGKTTALAVVSQLVPRMLPAANITTAAIFRSIEKFRPTFIFDEVETFLTRDNEEMRGVLNSGFTRASAYVIRTVGENFEPVPFSTWCPKVTASIGPLPGTIQDRAIVVPLRRRLILERTERFCQSAHAPLHELRSKAARWSADNLEALRATSPEMPAGLDDRAEDCWRPLLAIADRVGGPWPVAARHAATALSGNRDKDEIASVGELLLGHVREVLAGRAALPSTDLVGALNANEEWPWAEWRRGQPLGTTGLARMLAKFGIKPQKRSGHAPREYRTADFNEAWARYLPPADAPTTAIDTAASPADCSTSATEMPRDFEPPM